jgi:hypothetical protein
LGGVDCAVGVVVVEGDVVGPVVADLAELTGETCARAPEQGLEGAAECAERLGHGAEDDLEVGLGVDATVPAAGFVASFEQSRPRHPRQQMRRESIGNDRLQSTGEFGDGSSDVFVVRDAGAHVRLPVRCSGDPVTASLDAPLSIPPGAVVIVPCGTVTAVC